MKLLLDTNAFLWLVGGDERLSLPARQAIEQASEITLSAVSLWEITIKVSTKKLRPIPHLFEKVDSLGFERLGLEDSHLQKLENLPLIHKDPFDRLLIAQALSENVVVVTSDKVFSEYGVKTINAA